MRVCGCVPAISHFSDMTVAIFMLKESRHCFPGLALVCVLFLFELQLGDSSGLLLKLVSSRMICT